MEIEIRANIRNLPEIEKKILKKERYLSKKNGRKTYISVRFTCLKKSGIPS